MYNNIFYENDTNEVKGSYHDEYLEKRRKKNIFCILNWGMAVSSSRNMNFVKCRESERARKKFSMFDNIIFCIFLRILHWGLFC